MIARQTTRRRPNCLPPLLVLGLIALLASGCNRGNNAASSPAQSRAQPRSPTKATRDAERARLALRSLPRDSVKRPKDEGAQGPASGPATQLTSASDNVVAESDKQDLSAERFALLLPRGPIVVELRMTIDGRPFRAADEKMVDDVLAAADRNGDGRTTWGEIFADPKRILGQRYGESLKFSDRKQFMKDNDTNRNGLVDRDEARRLVARTKDSAAFLLDASPDYRRTNLRQSIVRTLLDANDDGALDGRELASAQQRLLIVDANDDHIVDWSELDDSLASDELMMTAQRHRHASADAAAIVLGANAEPQQGPNGGHDGVLTLEELRRLEQAAPQLVVSADFSEATRSSTGLALVSASPEIEPVETRLSRSKLDLTLQFAGCRLRFAIDERLALDEPAPSSMAAAEAMENSKSVKKPPPSRLAAIQAVACNEQDVLFLLLDVNQDHRLTPRELRQAKEALERIDSNGDGRVALGEIPYAMALWLGRGPAPETSPRRFSAPANADAKRVGPEWFVHMDSNRDQEVSAQEFPGSAEKFRSLDLNGDGFIVGSEARAAESATSR